MLAPNCEKQSKNVTYRRRENGSQDTGLQAPVGSTDTDLPSQGSLGGEQEKEASACPVPPPRQPRPPTGGVFLPYSRTSSALPPPPPQGDEPQAWLCVREQQT